jgi:ABC-type sugar transport system ATPase subunit
MSVQDEVTSGIGRHQRSGEPPILETVGIRKAFGHVQALDDVSISLWSGEIVALLGDNGAGKSTFIKVLSGVYTPDGGDILIEGRAVRFHSPADAVAAGISTVYQDLALVDSRSVAANLFLGREFTRGPFVDQRRLYREAEQAIKDLRADLPSVRVPAGYLSGGQRQAVAIGRAVVQGGRIIIMDEPTAALGVAEAERVLGLAEDLRAAEKAVLVISHNLQHVWAVADRIIVLHRGQLVGMVRKDETTVEQVVQLIVYGSLGSGHDDHLELEPSHEGSLPS